MTGQRAGLFLKLGGSVLAAGIAVALFLLGRSGEPPAGADAPGPAERPDRRATIAVIDREIDSLLARFGVGAESVKKRSFAIPEEDYERTERLAPLPDSVAAVSVNAAMNDMARRHGGRAAASENPRLGTVTVHVELDGAVIHTVILRKIPRKAAHDGRQTRPAT